MAEIMSKIKEEVVNIIIEYVGEYFKIYLVLGLLLLAVWLYGQIFPHENFPELGRATYNAYQDIANIIRKTTMKELAFLIPFALLVLLLLFPEYQDSDNKAVFVIGGMSVAILGALGIFIILFVLLTLSHIKWPPYLVHLYDTVPLLVFASIFLLFIGWAIFGFFTKTPTGISLLSYFKNILLLSCVFILCRSLWVAVSGLDNYLPPTLASTILILFLYRKISKRFNLD